MPPEAAEPPPVNGKHAAPTEALRDVGRSAAELKEYLSYFIAAELDRMKLTLRNLTIYAALGAVGLIAGGALVVTAVVLAIMGLAGLLNALINIGGYAQRAGVVPALGYLIVGLLLLGAVAGGAVIMIRHMFNSSRSKTIEKYENRRRQQTLDHGTNVHQRAQSH
jgi:hypothetical protein